MINLNLVYNIIRTTFASSIVLSSCTYVYITVIESLDGLKRKITDIHNLLNPKIDILKDQFEKLSKDMTEEHEKLSARIELEFSKIIEKVDKLYDNDRVFDILITRFEKRMNEYDSKTTPVIEYNPWKSYDTEKSVYLEGYDDNSCVYSCNN